MPIYQVTTQEITVHIYEVRARSVKHAVEKVEEKLSGRDRRLIPTITGQTREHFVTTDEVEGKVPVVKRIKDK